jgi:hypothetical protein
MVIGTIDFSFIPENVAPLRQIVNAMATRIRLSRRAFLDEWGISGAGSPKLDFL